MVEKAEITCPDYEPGPERGKHGPVCKWWNAANNGACNRQDRFMCEEWLRQRRVDDRKP